jgi:hypothetical protein
MCYCNITKGDLLMGTSKAELRNWVQAGQKKGATHVVIVCDTYDWEDYPIYVMPEEDVSLVVTAHSGKNMQTVVEVYSLTGKHTIEAQLSEHRARHLD